MSREGTSGDALSFVQYTEHVLTQQLHQVGLIVAPVPTFTELKKGVPIWGGHEDLVGGWLTIPSP